MRLVDQWRRAWNGLGVSITPALLEDFDGIIARYSEPHRRYHSVRHLDECFEKLPEVRTLAEHAAEVEVALWYHDAIYDTRSNQNEALSAELARTKVLAAGGSAESATRVHELIMATRHDVVPDRNDAKVIVDVDLSILGAPTERFDEYEEQVREEYSWVPEFVFREERMRILNEFLARAFVFNTRVFRERYEQQARANIERSIKRLRVTDEDVQKKE